MKKIARSLLQFDIARRGDRFKIWMDGKEMFGEVIAKDKKRIKLEIVNDPGYPNTPTISTRTLSRETIRNWSSFKILLNGVDRASRKMLQLKEND